ncbi:MAG: PAS domain S-box protein [Spirochaetota bacterium]
MPEYSGQNTGNSENNFRNLIEQASEGMIVLVVGTTVFANRAMETISGYSRNELVSMNIFDMLHPSDRPFVMENYRRRVSGENYTRSYNCRAIRKDGATVWVRMRVNPVTWEGEDAALVFMEDITRRIETSEEIDELMTRLNLAVEGAQDGLWDVKFDPEDPMNFNNDMWFSSQFKRLLGYTENDYDIFPHRLGTWVDLLHPDDRDDVIESMRDFLYNRETYDMQYRMRMKNGEYRWFHVVGRGMWDRKGRPLRASGSIRDTTERKIAEQQLRESEERFRVLHEASFGGIGIHDKGTIIECNRGLSNITGYTYDELIGMNGLLLIAPEYRDQVMEKIVSGYDKPYTTFGLKKNGTIYPLEIQGSNVQYYGKIVRVTEFRDITERYRMEDELRKMQRLESIGVLAGGIAHDFNNILTAIMGNISLARLKNPEDPEYFELLKEAEDAAYRARGLTAQFLTFAKGGSPVQGEASIREIITNSANFILMGSNISCHYNFHENLKQAKVDREQVSQLIQNLILNAKEAMPDGGEISIFARTEKIDRGSKLPLQAGEYISIRIQDNGTGISEEHINNIFDPYFTTREEGHGLGLSVVYSVIKRHGGYIYVESEPGKGAEFTFYLPAADSVDNGTSGERDVPVEGTGKVLLMDDDDALRRVAGRMLESLGYRVVTAADGDQAIENVKRAIDENQPFELLILDLTIPGGKGGKETIQDIRKIDPYVKAIVSSGYSDVTVMSDFREYGFDGVMAKPYRIEEMSRVLHDILRVKSRRH